MPFTQVSQQVGQSSVFVPNGNPDDGLAINNGIIALGPGGGVVSLGPGVYVTQTSIVQNADKVVIRGAGWATIIRPVASSNFDVIATPIPASQGLAGFIRNYLGIEQLMIDCSNMTGTTAGQGNAIHWYGVRYGKIDRVFVLSCKNWAILLDGDNTGPGNNFGFDNIVRDSIFDVGNAGIYNTNCEANDFTNNRFKFAGTATAALQPALGTQDTTAMHLRMGSGYCYVAGNVFGKGGTYTTEAIRCSNAGPCKIIGNRFDQVRNQAVTLNGGNHEFIGNALGSPGSAISGVPAIQIGSSNNRVIGNSFDTTAGGANFTSAIAEAGGPFTGNIIADNKLLQGTVAGPTGLISLNATSTTKVYGNDPYNPRGNFAAPTVPATTVALTNTFGVDCTVIVSGGTVTAIAIGGVATGLTGGTFRVPVGQTITLTYTAAPTWLWWGD